MSLVLLGVGGHALAQEPAPAQPQPASIPERLSQADIMSVVLSHKPEVVECVKAQRQAMPETKGKVVMRWTIQPNGQTREVSCVSGCEVQLSACLAGKIQTWTYPEHQKQGTPIDFPFTF